MVDERVFDEDALMSACRRRLGMDQTSRVASLIYQELYQEEVELARPEWMELWPNVRPSFESRYGADAANEMDTVFAAVRPTDPAFETLRLPESGRAVFILGAGCSVPPPSGLPTVAGLLPELWRRAAKLGREDLRELEEWCRTKSPRIDNIEDLLTAAYIANFASRNGRVLSLLDYFLYRSGRRRSREAGLESAADSSGIALLQDTLQTVFGLLLGRMISAQPNAAHKAIVKLSQARHTDVITTNYDGCIDQAFADAKVACNYFLQEGDHGQIPGLVKMHGSIHSVFCDSCQKLGVFDLAMVRQSYENDTLGFAVISVCPDCGGQRRPMIVPPLSIKFVQFPPLLVLWNRAERMLHESNLIVSIGYSFAEADTYITKMTLKAMSENPECRLVVIDPDPSVSSSLKRQLSAVIDDFDTSRVIRSLESCEIVVPRLAEQLAADAPAAIPENGDKPSVAVDSLDSASVRDV